MQSCTDIPFKLPEIESSVSPEVVSGKFAGFVNHYHVTNNKIDCAGMDNEKILQMAMKLS